MNFFKKASLGLLTLTSLTFISPEFAKAEGFALQDWSARGASLAGGLVARGGDASAVAYNPASITELEGTKIMFGGEIIALSNTFTNGAIKYDSKSKIYPAPHAYITHKANDSISLGLGIYSRYGLGHEYDENWFGNGEMYNIELLTSSITPVIAWRINDKLSLGLGFELMWADVELDQKHNITNNIYTKQSLTGDTFASGINLSVHYRFNDQWKAGFVYRSHTTLDFDGKLNLTHNIPAIIPAPTQGTYDGSATLYTPDTYTLAIAYYPTEKLSLEGQVSYSTWSNYTALIINLPDTLGSQYLPKNWDNTWLFSLSAEYEYNDWLTLRAGISHETSPVNEQWADYIAPVDGRWKYALGFGIKKNAWTFDMSYVYHDINSLNYAQSLSAIPSSRTEDTHAHTVGISFGYTF